MNSSQRTAVLCCVFALVLGLVAAAAVDGVAMSRRHPAAAASREAIVTRDDIALEEWSVSR